MIDVYKRTVYMPGRDAPHMTTHDYVATPDDYRHMGRAILLGRKALLEGDNPIGAVLVDLEEGQPWEGETEEIRTGDSEAHAEKIARRNALIDKPELGSNLSRCAMYSVAEPCVGCSHMMDQGNLGVLFIAATRDDAPDFFRKKDLRMHNIFKGSEHGFIVISGLMAVEALELLTKANKKHKWTGEVVVEVV